MRLAILWFRILLANHSPAVEPVSNFLPSAPAWAAATALAIMSLSSVNARRTAELDGREKKTSDQRTLFACVEGGGLPMKHTLASDRYRRERKKDVHYSVKVRAEDAPAENGQGVSYVANSMTLEGLDVAASGWAIDNEA